jgi:DNA-binding GntR family transcriptional regulator
MGGRMKSDTAKAPGRTKASRTAEGKSKGRARAPVSPAVFKSLTATVANTLQKDLISGAYLPGAKLPIVPLAKHYGVSPGAVREALSRLISEGLVEFNEQRGFRAAPVSKAALMDITRTRIMLDVNALRIAIREGDVDWEADVLAAQHRLSNCSHFEVDSRRINPVWVGLHRDFHRTLIFPCGSEWLVRFHDMLFDQTARYRSLESIYGQTERSDARRDVVGEHAEIVRAVVARDADAAAAVLERHYLTTAEHLIRQQDAMLARMPDRR